MFRREIIIRYGKILNSIVRFNDNSIIFNFLNSLIRTVTNLFTAYNYSYSETFLPVYFQLYV